MLSTRDLNTVYRGSMSKIIGREDTTLYDGVDTDTIATDFRPGSPNDGAFGQYPNAVSQYVKTNDLKPYMLNPNNYKDQSIPEYDDEGDGTYRN